MTHYIVTTRPPFEGNECLAVTTDLEEAKRLAHKADEDGFMSVEVYAEETGTWCRYTDSERVYSVNDALLASDK